MSLRYGWSLVVAVAISMAVFGEGGQPPAGGLPPISKAQKGLRVDAAGDPIPPGAITRIGTTRFRHVGPIAAICFLPDGKSLVTLGTDDLLCAWQPETG